MTLTVSSIEAIKDLVEKDSALREDLRGASSRQEFTSKLAAAALANSIVVDEAALRHGFDIAFDQYSKGTELSDEQLEGITGGVGIMFGVMVGMLAIVAAVGGALLGYVVAEKTR